MRLTRRSVYIAAIVLLAVVRWSTLAAILFTDRETSDTVAEIMFGPARLENDFPRLYLPAVDGGVLRFIAGELLWVGVAMAAAFVLVAMVTRSRASHHFL